MCCCLRTSPASNTSDNLTKKLTSGSKSRTVSYQLTGVGLLWAGLSDRSWSVSWSPTWTCEISPSSPPHALCQSWDLKKKKKMDVLQPFGVFVLVLECALWVEHTIIMAVCSVVFFFSWKKGTFRCAAMLTIQRCSLSLCYRRLSSCCVSGGRFAVLMATRHLNEAAGVLVFSIFVFLRARCVFRVTDFIISAKNCFCNTSQQLWTQVDTHTWP